MFEFWGGLMLLLILPASIAAALFWIQMLEDCARNERGRERFLWTFLMLTGTGTLLYYCFRWRPRQRPIFRLRQRPDAG
jgi:hypothetical protein